MRSALIGLVLGLSFNVYATSDIVREGMNTELAFIKHTFELGYAPAQWKQQQFNWDIGTQYQQALSTVADKTDITVADYRQIIATMLTSTRDYHVGFGFASTESASLPFTVVGAEGSYFVTWIDMSKAGPNFPLQVGDQVISWNGKPVSDELAAIKGSGWGVATTDARLSEMMLTRRSAARGGIVPTGRVDIEVKRADQVLKRELTWEYHAEEIVWNNLGRNLRPFSAPVIPMSPMSHVPGGELLRAKMNWGMWESWKADNASDSSQPNPNPYALAGRQSFVPTLGQVIWHSADTDKFDAYIYRNDAGKLIGYVRISSYMGSTDEFNSYKDLMKRFQATTDAMVIDQVDNPGGSVFYVYALMSVMSNQPIRVPDHQISMWPAMAMNMMAFRTAAEHAKTDAEAQTLFGPDMDGYPVTYQLMQSILEFTHSALAQWKDGKKLTTPLALFGVRDINPHRDVNYTKPILVLVNELDFSGGDFFPAILQDNQRAKIFGMRTSGAGGYVLGANLPDSLGLGMFSFTGSIAKRMNNQPIENLGVTPDIEYQLSAKDLTGGFVDYASAINAAVNSQINRK